MMRGEVQDQSRSRSYWSVIWIEIYENVLWVEGSDDYSGEIVIDEEEEEVSPESTL